MGPGRLAAEYLQTVGRKVGDVMTADVRTVKENSRLDEIVHIMERHQINRVLVVRDDKLVGIVTRANLLHALASVIAEAKPGLTSDASQSRAGQDQSGEGRRRAQAPRPHIERLHQG